MNSPRGPNVVVVGSLNLDVIVRAELRPDPGETVLGSDYEEAVGGKGLNQAVAASRVGPTAIVGAIGSDAAGAVLRRHLESRGVDVSSLDVSNGPTGRAIIIVTPDGENSIVVAPLANSLVRPDCVVAALDRLCGAALLAQREVPAAVVAAAATWAADHGVRFVLNPSPVHGLDPALLRCADPLIVNVHEARAILGAAASVGGEDLARGIVDATVSTVVTAGAAGSWIASGGVAEFVPAVADVRVVDTTGAGDEFAGSLAAHLAEGCDLLLAARRATRAAARVVATPRADR